MAGISKHYILRTGDSNRWDYTIPETLISTLSQYAPAVNGSRFEGTLRMHERLTAAAASVKSWRKKILIVWRMANPDAKKHVILTEFRVHPGRTAATCAFRSQICHMRNFKSKKAPKVARGVIPRAGINMRLLAGENPPPEMIPITEARERPIWFANEVPQFIPRVRRQAV